jgi:hypothetical protein
MNRRGFLGRVLGAAVGLLGVSRSTAQDYTPARRRLGFLLRDIHARIIKEELSGELFPAGPTPWTPQQIFGDNTMGIIAERSGRYKGMEDRQRWDRALGRDKEEGLLSKPPDLRRPGELPLPGGSWGRSAAQEAATRRLIDALRSMAPGGWSDDRYEETMRHFVGPNYLSIDRTGKMLQQAEFTLYRKVRNDPEHPDGKRPITEDDPPDPGFMQRPYQLVKLLERPNWQDSFGMSMYRWNQQLRLTGTALTMMVPSRLGPPCELYCIPTCIAIPQPVVNPDYPHGFYRIQPVYPYGPFSSYPTPNTAVGAAVPGQWMMRFQYPHPLLRYDGYSPLTGLKLEIDQLDSINRSRFYTMKRTLRPSAVLNFEAVDGMQALPEAEVDRIHAEFENEFQSPENAGKLIVTTNGASLEEFGSRPIDMDYPAGWDQMMSFVLGGQGMTKPVAGLIDEAAYATLFAALKQIYTITLQPDADYIASELTHRLGPFFGTDLVLEIRCKRIDDHEIMFAAVDKLITGKAITKNELRTLISKLIDISPTKQKWGEEIAGFESAAAQVGLPDGTPPEQIQRPPEAERTEPAEVTRTRPNPGTLDRGSLGPRKAFVPATAGYYGSRLNGRAKVLANGRK